MMAARITALANLGSGAALLAVALAISVLVGGRAITREESFFLQGDPPRYLLDGVFLYDLARAGLWTPADVMSFAERYYARYPALSLGHHPPGLPVTLVPFYAVLGVSVFAGRFAILTFFVIAVALLYAVTKALFRDERVAGWASLLFASSPTIGFFGQHLLAEMPAMASSLAAMLFVERFCRTGGALNYLFFVGAVICSLLYRPTAIYMLPVYAAVVLLERGYKRLADRRFAPATLLGALSLGMVVVGFLAFSPFNTGVVLEIMRRGLDWSAVQAMYDTTRHQRPLLTTMAGGVLIAGLTRDRHAYIPLIWAVSVVICAVYFTGSVEPSRYAVLAVPAFCILGAVPMAHARTRVQRAAWAFLLIVVIVQHLLNTWRRDTWDTPGYEAAAQYIVGQTQTPTVLYSASVDSGYFVFFVRKHDPEQRMVIMRSDKVLTTSFMGELSVEDRVDEPEDILDVLQNYGTRFVVIEDRPSGSKVLDWLRDLVRTDGFVERARFPIGGGHQQVEGVSLVVYEFLDATTPAPDAVLDLNIALVGRHIRVPLSDLLRPPLPAR